MEGEQTTQWSKEKGQKDKKSLKISEAGNRRRTYNIMDKRKREKGQTTIYKTLHRKLNIEQHQSGNQNP
jgi:hypothetical protein